MSATSIIPVLLISLCASCALSAALLVTFGDTRSSAGRRAVAVRLAQVALVAAGVLASLLRSE